MEKKSAVFGKRGDTLKVPLLASIPVGSIVSTLSSQPKVRIFMIFQSMEKM